MCFQSKYFALVPWICILFLHCLVYGKSSDGEVIRKHVKGKVRDGSQKKFTLGRSVHLHAKSKDKSGENGMVNGVRKDLLGSFLSGCEGPRCEELPVPVQIEHLKDYPVPVPVKHETAENILHVHIHDSKCVGLFFSTFYFCFDCFACVE